MTASRTRARAHAAVAVMVASTLIMISACTPRSNVSIGDLQTQTEDLAASLMAEIEGVDRYQDDMIASQVRWVDAEGNGEDPNAWRYWQWQGAIEVAADAGVTPQEAAERTAKILEDDGWNADEPVLIETGGGYDYRRSDDSGDWYVGISFTRKEPPAPQNLTLTIVSPPTNRSS